MHRSLKALVLPVALLLASESASAQSCSIAATTSSVNCTVSTTLSNTMSSLMNLTLSGTTVTLNAPSAITDFDAAGLDTVSTTGPSFQVKSNRGYRVQVSAAAATFTHTPVTGASTYAKPVANVLWSSDATSFTALTTTATDIASGSATNLSTSKTVTYKTIYDITKDQPGSYSLGVTFTLVAP